MLRTRWQPFTELWSTVDRLHREMNQLFDSFAPANQQWPAFAVAYPAFNIWEDDEAVYAEAELPGMEMNDLEIYVTGGNQLTVRGERKAPQWEQSTWHRRERGFGTFSRTIPLPVAVDADRVEATLTNGVLRLRLPRCEAAKPRKIAVRCE